MPHLAHYKITRPLLCPATLVSYWHISYYMQVTNDLTKELLGYLSDISTGGFKLDSQKQIAPGQDFRMHIELTPDIAEKNSMVFIARSKWCHTDYIDPNSFNVGFELVNMSPRDMVIF